VPIHESQLPAKLRDRARGIDPGTKHRAAPQRSDPCDYECATCGERFEWTTTATTSPGAIEHQDRTGHGRFRMVLT
jgi:hypothetical protein